MELTGVMVIFSLLNSLLNRASLGIVRVNLVPSEAVAVIVPPSGEISAFASIGKSKS